MLQSCESMKVLIFFSKELEGPGNPFSFKAVRNYYDYLEKLSKGIRSYDLTADDYLKFILLFPGEFS